MFITEFNFPCIVLHTVKAAELLNELLPLRVDPVSHILVLGLLRSRR